MVEEIESSGVIDSKRKNGDDNVDDVGRVIVKSRRGRKRDCKVGGRLLCVFVQAVTCRSLKCCRPFDFLAGLQKVRRTSRATEMGVWAII
jgi:hypothetical protein